MREHYCFLCSQWRPCEHDRQEPSAPTKTPLPFPYTHTTQSQVDFDGPPVSIASITEILRKLPKWYESPLVPQGSVYIMDPNVNPIIPGDGEEGKTYVINPEDAWRFPPITLHPKPDSTLAWETSEPMTASQVELKEEKESQ